MKYTLILLNAIFLMAVLTGCTRAQDSAALTHENAVESGQLTKATLGAGCFWCTEALFKQLKGVKKVTAGYAGGHTKNPTYRQVATGTTGHVEVARIFFDASIISYKQLLTVFWHVHNPTSKNRQGPDVGPQYRSVIFYHNQKQKKAALESRKKIAKSGLWDAPIVTEIEPLENFSKAENYHQNYYENNPNTAYCSTVIAPKIKKLRKQFGYLLKDEDKDEKNAEIMN